MDKKAKIVKVISSVLTGLLLAAFVVTMICFIGGIELLIERKANNNEGLEGIGLVLLFLPILIASIVGLILSCVNFVMNIIFIKKNEQNKTKANSTFMYISLASFILFIIIPIVYLILL